jgi:hypothetical protein
VLSLTRAVLGQKDAAIKEAERAIRLLPSGKDAVVGPKAEQNLASVEVIVGKKTARFQGCSVFWRFPILTALPRPF